jgi:DNA polymerase-3 subunit delta'
MHYQVTPSINSLSLFGYKDLFSSFVKMNENNVLPNTILLSGQQGIGKSTFAFHFINFLLSRDEMSKYSLENLSINPDNRSYKLLCEKLHSNFFLLENHLSDEIIKIEQIRNLLNFLNKSTYSKDLKIVLINNAEFLNKSSSNALLKVLEEPGLNTYFFIIHNNSTKLLKTIRSRSVNFKFHLSFAEKKTIFDSLLKNNNLNIPPENYYNILFYETPGNLFKIITLLSESGLESFEDKYSIILFLMDKIAINKNNELVQFLSLFVELYYSDLTVKNLKNVNFLCHSKIKILNEIDNYKKYNLDKKNLHTSLVNILNNA